MEISFEPLGTKTATMPEQLVSPSYVLPQNGDPNPKVVYVNPNIEKNCEKAAWEILEYLGSVGFSSDHYFDHEKLELEVTNIIKKNITGNINFTFMR